MKRLSLLALAAILGLGGCGYSGSRHAANIDRDYKWGFKPRPEYHEVAAKDGRIYVVGSKATADKVQAGEKLNNKWVAIGAGPKGETVVFETSKNGLESFLIEDYEKKHGVTLQ